ncbi:conserved hypothetical protein [Nitrosococcus halophilus Nc 4]|uniref:Uncharacterized protein n=1 Tax=Nitrosococcus halophilus (strain Nc4) TaxID=472759 RepID=D5BYJ2_NITHN|nr:hypothetical protein [Nitrosococcus halophilus]ADE15980.1 conserved hypothetical protein [Nitrosococcus halophilus Nc 4]
MDIFIYILIAIAIVGLTYLAYKRPEKYEQLFNPLYIFIFITYISLSIWNTAMMRALIALNEFIKKDELGAAKAMLETWQIPWIPLHTIVWFLFVYLLFLSFLPRMLRKEKTKKTKKP